MARGPVGLEKGRPINITPGPKAGKLLGAGMNTDILVKFTRAVETIHNSALKSNERMIGSISTRARSHLLRSILRPMETGEGMGGSRDRMTQRFTFGAKSGGAFVGRTFAEKNEVGFGYPDVARADQRTKGIWRVLEFGLGSRFGRPQKGVRVPEIAKDLASRYGSSGAHRLPRKFRFTSTNPAQARLRVLGGPATTPGKGQFGKFFLTRAIDEMVVEAQKEYQRLPTEAYR